MSHKKAGVSVALSAVILILLAVLFAGILILILIAKYEPVTQLSPIVFLHPSISIPSVLFVITAYLLKRRGRERFLAHYIAGTLAVSLTVIAFFIGGGVVGHITHGIFSGIFTLIFHFLVAFFVLSIVLVQGSMGMGMLLFGRTSKRISIHKRLSKWVLIVYLIQGALGLSILFTLLAQL